MIYISKGFKTNELTGVNADDPIQWLIDYNPILLTDFDINHKGETNNAKGKIDYILSGEMNKNGDGKFTRSDKNLLNKNLIILDYDDLEEMSRVDFLDHIDKTLNEYTYIVYETVRSRPGGRRFRLILEPDRPYTKEENKSLIEEVANLIGLPFDTSSITWSQLQGLPCVFNKDDKPTINYGYPYEVKVDIQANKKTVVTSNKQTELNSRSTTLTIRNYIKREEDNLKDYSNALSCIMVLAKSVQVGEISIKNAEQYASMLAMDNEEWKENNLKKLEAEIKNKDIKTKYSFMEKFSKAGGNNKRLTTIECATELLKSYHFVLLGNDEGSRLFVYMADEGIYTANITYIYRLIYPLEPQFTENQVRDVYFKIKMQCEIKEPVHSPNLIPVSNGIYDVKRKKLRPFTPELVFTTKISTNYISNPPLPSFDVDRWLGEIACNDEEIVTLLWQMINESLNGSFTRGKYFILVGDGANAKGTLQQFIINLVGRDNVSTLKMHEVGERFKPYQMVGKTLNIGDDIAGSYIEDSSNLQSITTGDYITVEQKGRDSFTVQLKLAMIFSANEIPRIRNKSNGTYRRMIIIPFNADFSGQIQDPTIKEDKIKRKDVLEYTLFKALQLNFKEYTIPKIVKQQVDDYKEFNNPILEFYNHEYVGKEFEQVDIVPTNYLFREYQFFCTNNGYKHKSQRAFTIEFHNLLGNGFDKKRARPGREFLNIVKNNNLYLKPLQCFVKK